MRLIRLVLVALGILAASDMVPSRVRAQKATPLVYVAYIERVYPSSLRLSDVISIRRNGTSIGVTDNADLSAGDEIRLLDPNAILTIRTVATRTLVVVRRHQGAAGGADFTVPASVVSGLGGGAFDFIKLAGLAANQARGDTSAASRGVGTTDACFNSGGQSDSPLTFDVPVLSAKRSLLVEGDRRLFLSWRGGAPPFKVVLSDSSTGKVLSRVDGLRSQCQTWLPPMRIVAGARYDLAVIDGNGVREEENSLFGASAKPKPPVLLVENSARGADQQLYIATWLAIQGDGEWTFEAEQAVTGLGCSAAGVKDWLASNAGTSECWGK